MKAEKGFTLVELMVVIVIVGILAGVAIPMMKGRIDSAKWTEGKASAGTIATALRNYAADNGTGGTYPPTLTQLGFSASDLLGTHFSIANYAISAASFTAGAVPELTFTITVTAPTGITQPSAMTLDEAGTWTEINN
jgi:prepilin-type N-terminal cleavage/methylation domain-containing protein